MVHIIDISNSSNFLEEGRDTAENEINSLISVLEQCYYWIYSSPIMFLLCILCIVINGSLLLNVLIRPILWTTVNVFLSVILLLNVVAGCLEFSMDFVLSSGPLHKDRVFHCVLTFGSMEMYKVSTLMLLQGIVFMRSMMVKRAGDIREVKLKDNEMSMRTFGFLVLIVCLPFIVIIGIIFVVHPQFPGEYATVRICRGLPQETLSQKESYLQFWLLKMICSVVFQCFTLTSHIRIWRYLKSHNPSYYSRRRRSFATPNQTLAATYLKAIAIAVRMLLLDMDLPNHNMEKFYMMKAYDTAVCLLECLFIPGIWLWSSWMSFPELWSSTNNLMQRRKKDTFGYSFMHVKCENREGGKDGLGDPKGANHGKCQHKTFSNLQKKDHSKQVEEGQAPKVIKQY